MVILGHISSVFRKVSGGGEKEETYTLFLFFSILLEALKQIPDYFTPNFYLLHYIVCRSCKMIKNM